MKHLYSAGVIVYTIENKKIMYLLLQYSAGHWDFAKGKIEAGETKQEAALRELHEEAGISAVLDTDFEEKIHYFFTDYDKQFAKKTVYFFTGKATETHVKLSYEHIGFAWLSYDDALKQLTYKNAQDLLKKVEKHITHHKKNNL